MLFAYRITDYFLLDRVVSSEGSQVYPILKQTRFEISFPSNLHYPHLIVRFDFKVYAADFKALCLCQIS